MDRWSRQGAGTGSELGIHVGFGNAAWASEARYSGRMSFLGGLLAARGSRWLSRGNSSFPSRGTGTRSFGGSVNGFGKEVLNISFHWQIKGSSSTFTGKKHTQSSHIKAWSWDDLKQITPA